MAEKKNASPLLQKAPVAKQDNRGIGGYSLFSKLCIILIAVSCIVYANTLYNGYVLDDAMMVGENQYVQQGLKGIPELLTTPHLKGYASNLTDTYRPLSLVMFAIEYQFFGASPAVGHFFNLVVFLGTVLMLFLFVHKLFDEKRLTLAFITALLFAVHPIHTEVVASIKSRDELLCFFLGFLALNTFINYARQGKLYQLLLATLYLFLSIISKETVVAFIGVIPLIFFFYKNDNRKRSVLITIASILVVASFTVIRAIIISKYAADGVMTPPMIDNPILAAPTIATRMATAILILGRYLKLLIIPYPLIFDYSYNSIPYVNFGNIWVLLSLALYTAMGICSIYRLIKDKKDPWAFGMLFLLFTLFLYSNIPFIIWGAQADRWLFFASAGMCLLIALALEKWLFRDALITKFKPWQLAVLLIICVTYSAEAIDRNSDWKDEYTLYSTDIKKSPENSKLNVFMGNELLKKYQDETEPQQKEKMKNESMRYLKKALEIYPDNGSAHAAIGTAFMIDNKADSAILHFKRAMVLEPGKLIAVSNIAMLYLMQEKYTDAIPYFRQTAAAEPNDIIALYNLGICYSHTGQYDSSISAFGKTIRIDPAYNNYLAFANTAVLYKLMDKIDSARKYEAIAKQYTPGFSIDNVIKK